MHRYIARLVMAILAATARISGAQAPSGPQVNVPPAASAATAARHDSDPYEFAAADSVTHVVRLSRIADGVRFTWPRTVTQWDTALLAVRSGGAEQDPYVEVSVGEFRIQQYLDTNAVGVRWLNLSSLREQLAGVTEVIIRTHALTPEAETATLALSDNHFNLQQRIM